MSTDSPKERDLGQTSDLSIVIVAARYNSKLIDSLLEQTIQSLKESGVEHITVERVPGSAELACAAHLIEKTLTMDALIALGVVIAGETEHHNVIAYSSAQALNQLSADKDLPVINGIIVTNTIKEAEDRCGTAINRGREFALAAIEMAHLNRLWNQKKN